MAKNAKNFIDKAYGLKWKIINSLDKDAPNNKTIVEKVEEYSNHLNTWGDEAVSKFIVDDEPLGNFIKSLIYDEYSEYKTCFVLKKINNKETPIGVAVLSVDTRKKCKIEDVVIDKNYRGKGLGTRMLSSIRDNVNEFVGYYPEIQEIYGLVRNDNHASQQALFNSGFICSSANTGYNGYRIFTSKPKSKGFTR